MTVRWVEVGVIRRPHGVKGELHILFHNPDTTLAAPGVELAAWSQGQEGEEDARRDLVIHRVRHTPKGWLVFFEGVGQREVAAALTNRRLFVRRDSLPPLDEGEFYQTDLIGCLATSDAGEELGEIVGFFDNGAHDVVVIRRSGDQEVLLPFLAETVVELDLVNGTVKLDVPDGIPGLGKI